ncbi:NADP-dependent oxidoreductase [Bacillus thuringiensis]|uniref:NADP-dependent oxidoreductase n=3 Tax=Bacillus thuringiensis TaxID=1428 RepID=A0AB35PGP0_BACTU|nr:MULTISPECIES: NADP-dependent oxidoreductase [Bacillus]EAO53018.1 Quinone oxidoreductase [Bacillus thuringiensis serovar israelensis ATCC 35646]MED1157673.1 NADP-dependent oxidoreductase [Bacillus paranthracis]AFQ27132.1 oxidoreductase, zinc-binding dehydrogenase family protein [Bacillus thuringiensis HD-789]AJH06038.1 zinc-binding dehydrogenase family protein [Bacillus thuringiensis HD1002]AND25216.1 NADPH:quinone reductase [Bacillus thuringiensis serovar israelensis]
MKAMIIDRYGKVPMRMAEVPTPEIKEYEVLAEIHAASINPIDFKIRDGKVKMLLKYEMPLILGNDFAGVITKVGSKVTRFKVGDAIYARPRKNKIGTFAEYIAIHEDDIALKPKNLSFEEAASIPLVGLTSYQALHDIMQLQKGQKILIHAGSGGVGTFAIQLAKIMGATVTTTASEAGANLVTSLGADEIINYKTEKFEDILKNYDAVFDTIGGATLEKSFNIIKSRGNIVSVSGMPNARFGKEFGSGFFKTLLFSLASKKLTALEKKHNAQYSFLFMKPSGDQLRTIANYIEAGKIKPVIDQVFPFEDAQKAMEYSESGRAKGKIIVKIK